MGHPVQVPVQPPRGLAAGLGDIPPLLLVRSAGPSSKSQRLEQQAFVLTALVVAASSHPVLTGQTVGSGLSLQTGIPQGGPHLALITS